MRATYVTQDFHGCRAVSVRLLRLSRTNTHICIRHRTPLYTKDIASVRPAKVDVEDQRVVVEEVIKDAAALKVGDRNPERAGVWRRRCPWVGNGFGNVATREEPHSNPTGSPFHRIDATSDDVELLAASMNLVRSDCAARVTVSLLLICQLRRDKRSLNEQLALQSL